MRFPLASLFLLCALPAFGQGAPGRWFLDLHWFQPSLSGHYQGTSGGNAFDVDLVNDLGLAKGSTSLGFGVEYQGPRFGLTYSRDAQDYRGSEVMTRDIVINGQTFAANTLVNSSVKAVNNTLNWTIRCLRRPGFWLGLDLGVRATEYHVDATGFNALTEVYATANYKGTLPMPQVGPALGFNALQDRLLIRGFYHGFAYERASYGHAGADLRYFPVAWLGVMAFVDSERSRVPQGALKGNWDATLDRSGAGLGLVARF